jgi:periplasmic divalent cation tolerance protein
VSVLLVLCTCPPEAAERLAAALVEEQLAACVNVLPGIQSVYRWQGAVERSAETLLLAKTTSDRYPALETRLRALHPYELPEIIALPIERGLPGYLSWVSEQSAAG